MMRQLLVPLLSTVLVAGCATVDTNPESNEVKEKKEYVTGSNIPQRDRSSVSVAGRESVDAIQRASGGPTTKGTENR